MNDVERRRSNSPPGEAPEIFRERRRVERQVRPARPYHLEQIAAFCADYPIESKVLFVSSRQVGANLLSALARSGYNWINLEPLSPANHAERETSPRLRTSGLNPLHTDTAHVVVTELLRSIKTRRGNYFEPVAVTPSLSRSVWDTLRGMRLAGINADQLATRSIAPVKSEALRFLLVGFEKALKERGLYDDAVLLQAALEDPPTSNPVAIMEELNLTSLELEYVQRRFKRDVRVIGRDDYGLTPPVRSARVLLGSSRKVVGDDDTVGQVVGQVVGQGVGQGGQVGQIGHVSIAGNIKLGALDPSCRDDVVVWGARGPESEVADIIRLAIKDRIPFDEIEIAYSRANVYLPLLVDSVQQTGVAVTFGEGIPVNLTRPGRALIGILQWMIEDYPVGLLSGLMQGGFLAFHRAVADVTPEDNVNIASALQECVIGEGRDRYKGGIEALRSRMQSDLDSGWRVSEHRQRTARLLSESISELFSILPPVKGVAIRDVTRFCVRFLSSFTAFHGEQDTRALESLTDRMTQFGEDESVESSLRFACQSMIDMVDRHKVQAATARPGTIHAVPIARSGYTGRRHMFVIGLDVDNFPGRVSEDPILLDFEREVVSANLGVKGRQATDTVWDLVRGLGMAAGRVYLSSSVFNAEREEVVVYPSPFFQQAATDLGHDFKAPPSLHVEDVPLNATEALLPQRRRVDYRSVCAQVFPWQKAGAFSVSERRSDRFTRFDGLIGDGGASGAGSAGGTGFQSGDEYPVFSANRLEDLAACPHRYFLNDVLRARKPRYYEFDTGRWLSAMDFGRLLHSLFQRFMTVLRDRDERPTEERHGPELRQMLDDLIQEYKIQFPVDNQAAYEFECRRLALSAEALLRVEAADPNSRPLYFELAFGMRGAGSDQLRNPVVLKLGDDLRIALRGRIDRIDETPEGMVIWDYKSGSSWKYRQDGLSRDGLNLQWVLYAHVVNQESEVIGLAQKVTRSGYYFANDRENGRRIAEPVPKPSETGELLSPLFKMVKGGAFLHVNKAENECNFCDFKSICSSESKLADDIDWIENFNEPVMEHVSSWMRKRGDGDA